MKPIQEKPLERFFEECQLFAKKGNFVVQPYVVYEKPDTPVLLFAFHIVVVDEDGKMQETYDSDSIVYENFTPENVNLTKALFPSLHLW